MNRRSFIQRNAINLSVLVVPSILIRKNFKSETIIGHNDFRYRVITGWGLLDAGKNPVNDCHEMVEDNLGRLILLTNEIRNNIIVYDKSGKLIDAWGTSFPGAHGLTIWDEGGEQFLFITDTERNQVIKCDMKGRIIMKLDYPKESGVYRYPAQYKPTETAIDPKTGDIYVADGYGLNYIIKYTSTGEYISHFGGLGDSEDAFMCCHGILVDTRVEKNELIVTNRSKMQFKRFSLSGEFLSTIEVPGSFVCRPVLRGDKIYSAVYRSTREDNPFSGYITILDNSDKIISTPGGTEPIYVNDKLVQQKQDKTHDIFMHPHDVCVDKDENIYIPQWASKKTYPIKLERV